MLYELHFSVYSDSNQNDFGRPLIMQSKPHKLENLITGSVLILGKGQSS